MKRRSSSLFLAAAVAACLPGQAQTPGPDGAPPTPPPPPVAAPAPPQTPAPLAPPRGNGPGGEQHGPGGEQRGPGGERGRGGPGVGERGPRPGFFGGGNERGDRGGGPGERDGRREGGPGERDGRHEAGPGERDGRRQGGPGERDGRLEGGPGERGGRDSFRGGFGRGGEGPGAEHAPAQRTPQPYLGVMASPVPPPLTVQLGLKEGFGLLVQEVLPNSPAATAGVQKYDVLKLLNDQQLVDVNQLSTLVRGAGKDAEVTLTVIRTAAEQKLTVKIGEQVMPAPHAVFLQRDGGAWGNSNAFGGGQQPFWRGADVMRDRLREFREWHEQRMHNSGGLGQPGGPAATPGPGAGRPGPGPGGPNARPGGPENRPGGPHGQPGEPQPERVPRGFGRGPGAGGPAGGPPTAEVAPEDLLRQAQPGGGAKIQLSTESGLTTIEGSKARLFLKDNQGEIEVVGQNGARTLTARDAKGNVVFTGPVDTEEQRKAVPAEIRHKIEAIRLRRQTTTMVQPGTASAPAVIVSERTVEPEAPEVQ